MLETDMSYLQCALTNYVARIARRVAAPCTRVGVAEASHQPPRGFLVLVAPTENATDESDDDCYNKVHWTTHLPYHSS